MPDEPHRPAGSKGAAEEHHKAIQAVANHVASGIAVRDSENDGGEERKHKRGAEVGELNGHCFFPIAMW